MVYAIYASKFSLSSTSAMKIYINLEILEVAKIIDKCIFLKFIIKKKKSNKWHILTNSAHTRPGGANYKKKIAKQF